jgi:hypothetical protein
MILEAFSEMLKIHHEQGETDAHDILNNWILEILRKGKPVNNVDRVIHAEFALLISGDETVILPKSHSGEKLLNSLKHYCESYDHWMFRRWLHQANASHFG